MKKTITVLTVTVILLSLLSISVFAESDVLSPEEGNIFDTVYGIVLENSDKILSALAFLSSVMLMLIYKKGLLPILKSALASLAASISKMKEAADSKGELAGQALADAAQKLGNAERIVTDLSYKLSELEEKLRTADELRKDSEMLAIIMNCQIDMLSDVFMSSSLPAYQKEALGEKISNMRKTLNTRAEARSNEEDEY